MSQIRQSPSSPETQHESHSLFLLTQWVCVGGGGQHNLMPLLKQCLCLLHTYVLSTPQPDAPFLAKLIPPGKVRSFPSCPSSVFYSYLFMSVSVGDHEFLEVNALLRPSVFSRV